MSRERISLAVMAVAVVGSLALAAVPAHAAKTLSVDDVTVTEPDGSATTTATFTVEISKKPKRPVKADWLTAPDTATGGSDYVNTGGVVTIKRRQKRTTLDVTVNGDDTFEPDETFEVQLANPRRAQIADGTGVGTIDDNDPQPPPALVGFALTESCLDLGQTGALVGTVTLDQPAEGNTFVAIASSNGAVATVPGGGATVLDGQTSAGVTADALTEGTTQLTATLATAQFQQTLTVADPCPDPEAVLNEVDYDMPGSPDDREFVEILNTGGVALDLSDTAILLFNGNAAGTAPEYARITLGPGALASGDYMLVAGSEVAVPGGVQSVALAENAIQNGARDGIALVDTESVDVLDALSYENGGANGAITQAQPGGGWPGTIDLTEGGIPTAGEADDIESDEASVSRIPSGLDTDAPLDDWIRAFPTPGVANTVLNETDRAAEADLCRLQSPLSFSVSAGAATPSVVGRVIEDPLTDPAGADPSIEMQVGFGPIGTDPRANPAWSWSDAAFSVQVGDEDEYAKSFTAPAAGSYAHAYRFSLDGTNFTYCDSNGAGSDPGAEFSPDQLGTMTVIP